MAFVGVLMLDTQFPRPLGDIGNRHTFTQVDIPVLYQVVAGASPERVVRQGERALFPTFITAGKALVAQGATLITTSCGFLVQFQAELEAALPAPVLTSACRKTPDHPMHCVGMQQYGALHQCGGKNNAVPC